VSDPEHRLSPVCILAGGLGSRLGDEVRDTPKPLLSVAGEPFLVHQLRLLARAGAQHVVLCVGYLGEYIEEVIGDERFGIRIDYSYDGTELLGTLGAIRQASPLLGERFLTLYGDTYLRVDYRSFDVLWKASGLPGAMAVFRNRDKWDRSNAEFADGLITQYDKLRQTPEMEWVDYGLGGLTVQALSLVDASHGDLADLQHLLSNQRLLFGYQAVNRFYEIGTPAALREAERFLSAERDREMKG